ncbi:unnamed protein product, partial [Ectocarpus sp. 12 AP-2014]
HGTATAVTAAVCLRARGITNLSIDPNWEDASTLNCSRESQQIIVESPPETACASILGDSGQRRDMEPESPRVEQVGGILSRGEDTDGERTDDEVDFPPESSYVSQHQPAEDEDEQQSDSAEELEVTGEGTAGGPFGLKKVLFVRKKSEKGVGSKEEPSFKDRFNKLGAGVGERFAAFGHIIQEHGNKSAAASGSSTSGVAEKFSAPDATSEAAQVAPQGGTASAGPPASEHHQQQAMEYFQEYEVTFTTKPTFSLVGGADGRGAVVSWDTGTAPPSADSGGAPASVPPSGAAVIAVSGESVAEKKLADVLELLEAAGKDLDIGREEGPAKDNGVKLSVEVPPDPAGGGGGGLVVRFREKMKPQHETGSAGGEVFRNKMKAMATGIGNLFQAKETAGSAVRDGSNVSVGGAGPSGAAAAAAAVPDAFPLTFSAGSGTVEDLPFTMAEVVGGLGVIVAAVRDDYAENLIVAEEAGVVSAGTAGVAAGGGGSEEGGGGRSDGPDVLVPGALILRVAGQNVEGKGMGRVRKALETAAVEHSAVKILFRRAPPIYRASVAAELALEQSKVPQVHVGTWPPLLKRRAGVTMSGDGENGGGGGGGMIGLGYGGEEWEDVQATMARAHRPWPFRGTSSRRTRG